jgi:GT2 family glycosyltransferase
MEHPPNITIVVVNWNSGKLLERCLSALARQTLPPRRVMVVDNGSSDGSLSAIGDRYSSVQILTLGENIGFAAANNLAVAMIEDSDWVALLNPDAFPEPGWLAALWRAVQNYPDYAFFGSRMLKAGDPSRLDGTGDMYHVSGCAWRRDEGAPSAQNGLAHTEIFSPCAAAALYRRNVLQEAGGFDERYFCYFEDVDLGFRLRLAGYRCLYVPDAVVHHIGSATTGRRSDFAIYHGHRNLVWAFCKNMPWPLFWIYLPQHLMLNIASLLWFSLQGRARVIFRAKWHALRGLPDTWPQRRLTQSRRKISSRMVWQSMARGWLAPYLK